MLRRCVFATSSNALSAIKKLRDLSGAPISDVKIALEETQYDFDKAYDALRLKGLAVAAKKATRLATEGLIGVATAHRIASVVEINCETDFVARNEQFSRFVQCTAQAVLQSITGSISPDDQSIDKEHVLGISLGETIIEDEMGRMSSTFREKIDIRRVFRLNSVGEIYSYCHNKPPGDVDGVGKIACVVSLGNRQNATFAEDTFKKIKETNLGLNLAMHIAAMKPLYIDKTTVDSAHLEKEIDVLRQQAMASGKPANVIDRIVEGRLKKFYESVCLLQQKYVLDEERTVEQTLKKFSTEHKLQQELAVLDFLRIQCGEGLQKPE